MKPRDCVLSHFPVCIAAFLLMSVGARADTVYTWSYDGNITEISQNGTASILGNTGSSYNGPVGLAVDASGNLFSGNPSNSTITRYSISGGSSSYGMYDSVSGLTVRETLINARVSEPVLI